MRCTKLRRPTREFNMFSVLTRARKMVARATLVASALWLAACEPIDVGALANRGGPSISPGQPVTVALLVPRSDGGAGPVARSLENAARLAVADLQGASINLRVYDTAGSATQAATVAQAAVDDGAKIILGPLFSQAAVAASVAVADEGINVISFSNTRSIAGGNLFLIGDLFDNRANRLFGYGRRQGIDSVAVLHTADVPGQTGRDAILRSASRQGINVVGTESYALTTESLTAALARTAGHVSAGADALFLTDEWAGGLSVALQLGPEAGINPATTQYLGLSRWDARPDGFNLPGIEGGLFTMPDTAAQQGFAARYSARYGGQPHPLGGLGFDAVAAVAALVADGRRDALTGRSLTQSAGFQGTGGVFRFLPDGTNQRALSVATIRNREVVILDPAPRSFAGF